MTQIIRRTLPLCALGALLLHIVSAPASSEIVEFDLGANGVFSIHGRDLDGLHSGTTTAFGSTFGSTFAIELNAKNLIATSAFNLVPQGLAIKSRGSNQADQIDATTISSDTDSPLGGASVTGSDSVNITIAEGFQFQLSDQGFSNANGSLGIRVVGIQFEGIDKEGEDVVQITTGTSSNFVDHETIRADGFFHINEAYDPGDDYVVRYIGGNGFRVHRIIVDVHPTPEPSSFFHFVVWLGVSMKIRRRRGS